MLHKPFLLILQVTEIAKEAAWVLMVCKLHDSWLRNYEENA